MKPQYEYDKFIYKNCSIRMSQKAMANLLYAVIITHSRIPTTFGIGIYEYERTQNSFNNVDIKIHIHPEFTPKFEQLSGCKLKEPIRLTIN